MSELLVEPAPDAAALELARFAADTIAEPGTVGDYLGYYSDGDGLTTHLFACKHAGYVGWNWSITLASVEGDIPSVCDTVLVPGSEAIKAPVWVPWADRLAPGDLGPGDELAFRAADENLEAGFEATGEEDVDETALWELGLGRPRVLSRTGRLAAARRWYEGAHGPTAEVAVAASAPCSSCGYFLPMAGALRSTFGVCANEWSPSDGRVVSLDHGCGAHSETDVRPSEPEPVAAPVLDDMGAEPIIIPPAEAETGDADAAESVLAEVPDAELSDTQEASAGVAAEVSEAAGEAEVPAEVAAEAEVQASDDVS